MGHRHVEDGEERHPFGTVLPMCRLAAFVPGRHGRFELVVGLYVVGAVVARGTQKFGVAFHPVGRYGFVGRHEPFGQGFGVRRPHVIGPERGREQPGDERCPAGCADADGGEHARISNTLPSEAVEIGRVGQFVAVTAQIRTDVFAYQAENEWPPVRSIPIPGDG